MIIVFKPKTSEEDVKKIQAKVEEKGLETQWETGEDVFRWWMNDDNLDGQMELSDFIEY